MYVKTAGMGQATTTTSGVTSTTCNPQTGICFNAISSGASTALIAASIGLLLLAPGGWKLLGLAYPAALLTGIVGGIQ